MSQEQKTESLEESVSILIGDIIQLMAPSEPIINETIFLVDYVDNKIIKLISTEDGTSTYNLVIKPDGNLSNESITGINILSRSDKVGYSRQNNLFPNTWIDVFFGGDLPTTITGLITNLEEDMIEIKTYPDDDVIYIDFGYKGIPRDLPIERIVVRNAPAELSSKQLTPEGEGEGYAAVIESERWQPDEDESKKSDEWLSGESEMSPQEQENVPIIEIRKQIKELLLDADQIQFGEELEGIVQYVDVPEQEQRYPIDKQVNDLLDEMLSTIPSSERTPLVLNNIHKMIERFKQLRTQFSDFDKLGNANKQAFKGANYKPLVKTLQNFNNKLYWFLPVCKTKKIVSLLEGGKEDMTESDFITDFDALGQDFLSEQYDINQEYKNNVLNDKDGANKYTTLITKLTNLSQPFEQPDPSETDLIVKEVGCNLNAIIDNLGDFESSVIQGFKKEELSVLRRKFIIQTYNLGLNRLQTTEEGFSGFSKIKTDQVVKLTANDKLTLKSYITLPEPAFLYSHINLPGTNILERANLNQHNIEYWRLLRKKTTVNTYNVKKDSENPEKYILDIPEVELRGEENKSDPFSVVKYLNNIKEFTLNEDIQDEDKYEKYLEAIVPKTRTLFELIVKYIKGGLSFNNIVKYMEPFMIYHDDLSFKQYEAINNFIEIRIREFIKNYEKKRVEYRKAYNNVRNQLNPPSIITSIFNSKSPDINRYFIEMYKPYNFNPDILDNFMSDSERLNMIYTTDFGRAFMNLMENDSLVLDKSFIDDIMYKGSREQILQTGLLPGQVGDDGSGSPSDKGNANSSDNKKCQSYVLAKKYIELDELTDDNSKRIFFDKKLDPTRYEILDEYKTEQKTMNGGEFQEFLWLKLKDDIGLTGEILEREVSSLLNGRREVVNGDYALLETQTDKEFLIKYYKRTNNIWEIDDEVSDKVFAQSNKLFCNLQTKCYSTNTGLCTSIKNEGIEFKEQNLEQLLDEFSDSEYNNIKDIMLRRQSRINRSIFIKNKLINDIIQNLDKYSYDKYIIGTTVEIHEIVKSPHAKLRDLILGQTNFTKKQTDIIKFVKKYAREARDTEDQYWYYCPDTDVKLLPTFLEKLAIAFAHEEDYNRVLDKICADQGTKSDDGDKWVDKHSGYTICDISFDAEEGYDENGFKVNTRALIEEEWGENVKQGSIEKTEKALSKYAKSVLNIINAISNFMGINLVDHNDFIIAGVLKVQSKQKDLQSKEAYDRKVKVAMDKGEKKKLPSFEDAYNQSLVYITLSYILISILTATPSITTRKTFPGCVKSFTGYPLSGEEDKTALTYIACIANKIKSSIKPWNSLGKSSSTTIAANIERVIKGAIIVNTDVIEKLDSKRAYLLENPDIIIPDVHDIANWTTFLPPLREIRTKTPVNVSSEFKTHLTENVRAGRKQQDEQLKVIRAKIIAFSFEIQKSIQDVITKEEPLLKTISLVPFMENSCCDKDTIVTSDYFTSRQPNILAYNEIVKELENIIYDMKEISEASIIFDNSDTRMKRVNILSGYLDKTIYRAFIHFCKFDTNIPLNDEMKQVCLEKPDEFDPDTSLDNQIRQLRQMGKNYSINHFEQLMDIVNKKNIVHIDAVNKDSEVVDDDEVSNQIQALRDLARNYVESSDPKKLSNPFYNLLSRILDTYDIALKEDTQEMRDMKNFLDNENKTMLATIKGFLTNNSKLGKKDLKKIELMLTNITDFSSIRNSSMTDEDATKYKSINFIRNSLRQLVEVLPTMVLNKVNYTNNRVVVKESKEGKEILEDSEITTSNIVIPKHWKLSKYHASDIKTIINKHYEGLYPHYGNTDLTKLLNKITVTGKEIYDLAENTPYYAMINQKGEEIYSVFNERMSGLLFNYYLLTVIMQYINLKDDRDMIIRESVKSKDSDLPGEDEYEYKRPDDPEEIEIVLGDKKQFTEQVAALLVTFIKIIQTEKETIDYNYEKIMERVLRAREKEKSDITTDLEQMSREDRQVQTLLKKNKLGRWNLGLQKGLTRYVGEFYDNEREVLEARMAEDIRLGKNLDVVDMNREIYRMDMAETDQANAEMDKEAYDISHLPNDDDFEGREDREDVEGYAFMMDDARED